MGEAKRRKKSDPDYGKKAKEVKRDVDSEEKKNVDYVDLEEEEFIEEEEEGTVVTISFDFEVKGITEKVMTGENHEVSNFGSIQHRDTIKGFDDISYSNYPLVFSKACECVIDSLYEYEIERKGYEGLSEVTVTIRNLEYFYS